MEHDHGNRASLWYFGFGELTVIDASGKDRHTVLNNLTTNQVKHLTAGQGCEVFFPDVKGKTLGHGWIFETGDALRIIGVPGQSAQLLPHLDRYVIREDVQWHDRSSEWTGIAIGGQAISSLLNDSGLRVAKVQAQDSLLPWWTGELAGKPIQCLQMPWTDASDWMLLVAPEHAPELMAWLQSQRATEVSQAIWELNRIEHLTPWYGRDFDTSHLPQELDRNAAAISFTKGCYLGQETIARLDALGQVQKKLAKWKITSSQPLPANASLLAAEKVVATISSAASGPSPGEFLGMGMTRRSHFPVGSRAQLAPEGSAIRVS